jgi:hypothetical protein
MKTYLISYDLVKPESSPEYSELIEMIKTANFWTKPMKSFWLIKTDLTSLDIIRQLQSVISGADKIYVVEVTKNWTAFNLADQAVSWLKQ